MKKLFAWFPAWLLLGLAITVWASPQDPQKPIEEERQEPRGQAAVSVKVDQVRVDVTVQDKDGNLITGLQREHFKVYEDKVQQEVTYFEPIEAPMTVVLITEYSRAMFGEWLWEVLMSSYTFVQQMRAGDWVAVVAYDIRPEILVDFTQNHAEVYAALRRLNFPAFSESNLYDTMYDMLDRLEESDGRTAIILISTGQNTISKKNLDEILKKVKQSDSVIYPVSIGGNLRARYEHRMPDMYRMDLYQADATLKAFAQYTGGVSFFPRFEAEYNGIFQTISALLRHQYSLGYVSNNTNKKNDYRKIKIEISLDLNGDGKPDKLKINHREGYQVQEETS